MRPQVVMTHRLRTTALVAISGVTPLALKGRAFLPAQLLSPAEAHLQLSLLPGVEDWHCKNHHFGDILWLAYKTMNET